MISFRSLLKETPVTLLKNLIFRLWLADARFKLTRIRNYLRLDDRILDIGTGAGSVCILLETEGYNVTPLDVYDRTLTERIKPVMYDGNTIPYSEKSFDTALIATVLHHTEDPRTILSEAKRVASNIVIIEDVYTNVFQKYLTFIFDSLFNFEFRGHPHSNKTDSEWKELFEELGLTLKGSRYDRFLYFFRQATYCLEHDSI
jgi:SAM-dependent methyltransferase